MVSQAQQAAYEATLARKLGLTSLRIGLQTLRDERHWRVGALEVLSAWLAIIEPSFDDIAAIGVVRSNKTTCRGNTFGPWLRAAMLVACHNDYQVISCVSADIETDPIDSLLRSMNLLESDSFISLDGIGYEISIQSGTISSSFSFSNPKAQKLVDIERGLFSVAAAIADASDDPVICKYIQGWSTYLAPVVRDE